VPAAAEDWSRLSDRFGFAAGADWRRPARRDAANGIGSAGSRIAVAQGASSCRLHLCAGTEVRPDAAVGTNDL
jgi:hypothetical protein